MPSSLYPHTAYLVMVLDVRVEPPVVRNIDIFSESSPTMSQRFYPVTLYTASRATYDEAHRALVRELSISPRFAWMLPLIGRSSTKAEIKGIQAQQFAQALQAFEALDTPVRLPDGVHALVKQAGTALPAKQPSSAHRAKFGYRTMMRRRSGAR